MSVIVRMAHLRGAKMCSRGCREFALVHGWDWDDFLENGIDSDILLETGDAMAEHAVAVALEEDHGQK